MQNINQNINQHTNGNHNGNGNQNQNQNQWRGQGLYDPSFEHDNCGIGAVIDNAREIPGFLEFFGLATPVVDADNVQLSL